MIVFIGLAVLVVGLTSVVTCAVHVAAAVRMRSAAPLLHPWVFVQAAVVALFCAGLAFLSGHMTGFDPTDPSSLCNGRVSRMFRDTSVPESRLVTRSVVPVSVVCEEYPGDPDATEQVPGWVNPVVFAGGGLGLGAAGLAPFAGALRRRLCRPGPGAA
ncbi:hypothetical protein [Streptomyces lavendulae]|uniref:hypothetical protein n=1 Tax=Streptomyces lavendulae TaxID=1914 RepID=UPI0024A2C187|nr:hypothetical protein [Streptomyces lavendulae]GLX19597.1 hypothetical protein Slala01_32410 [Streptomyces lavendulae subsp. lavendulae]GLX27092.1 hypothetical protein Slala02_29120 [Streptomyces lavendulae subsp. lavendulae]